MRMLFLEPLYSRHDIRYYAIGAVVSSLQADQPLFNFFQAINQGSDSSCAASVWRGQGCRPW